MGAAASAAAPPAADAPPARPAALVVVGPSGVGKGTLIKRLVAADPDAYGFSCSHTTRRPRSGEEVGDGESKGALARDRGAAGGVPPPLAR
jgi:ribose 1,5-bisphosphokinase PhnN